MPKAARISTSASVSQASQNSDREQFVSIALFSGIGPLMSLLVAILDVRGSGPDAFDPIAHNARRRVSGDGRRCLSC
jgi:hypothetical protein